MSGRVVAFAIALVALASAVVAAALAVPNGNASPGFFAMLVAAGILFAAVGAIIVASRPDNLVGWILSAIGLLWTTGGMAEQYAEFVLVTEPGSGRGGIAGAWYAEWFWIPWLYLTFVFLLFLFPTGGLPSPRWRPVLWIAILAGSTFTFLAMVQGRVGLATEPFVADNPIGLLRVGDVESAAFGTVLFMFLPFSAGAALTSIVVRFRRSSGDERLQLKWFTYAGAVLVVGFVLQVITDALFGSRIQLVDAILFAFVPISIAFAVQRHRLYDIDVVINRTIVYAALTAVLGLVYAAGVVSLGGVLSAVTDQENQSLAVAASTLLVAALFRPARGRIQGFIDRRFYRAKYDAVRTLEAFSGRLREEVDLDSLSSDLLGVVLETVQPSHASLWLLPGNGRKASLGLVRRNDFDTLTR